VFPPPPNADSDRLDSDDDEDDGEEEGTSGGDPKALSAEGIQAGLRFTAQPLLALLKLLDGGGGGTMQHVGGGGRGTAVGVDDSMIPRSRERERE